MIVTNADLQCDFNGAAGKYWCQEWARQRPWPSPGASPLHPSRWLFVNTVMYTLFPLGAWSLDASHWSVGFLPWRLETSRWSVGFSLTSRGFPMVSAINLDLSRLPIGHWDQKVTVVGRGGLCVAQGSSRRRRRRRRRRGRRAEPIVSQSYQPSHQTVVMAPEYVGQNSC